MKELIEAAKQGNLVTVEQLLAIEDVKKMHMPMIIMHCDGQQQVAI